MTPARVTACLLAGISLVGCTQLLGGKDQIVGRYRTAGCWGQAKDGTPLWAACRDLPIPGDAATASAVSITTPPSTTTVSTQLPERAEAEAIKLFGDPKNKLKATDLAKDLKTLSTKPDDDSAGDQTILHRTIIVSVKKSIDLAPADRIYATDVSITLQHARFIGWDTLSSSYNTVNAGTVSFTQANGLTEGVSAAITGPSITPSLTASQTDTRAESFTATPQTEGLTAILSPGRCTLTIHRAGGTGLELAGNTVIKADIEYVDPPDDMYFFSVDSYVGKNKKPLAPALLKLTRKPVATIPLHTPIKASIGMNYAIWHVVRGDQTCEEGDDDVQKIDMSMFPQLVDLVPEREASPSGYVLKKHGGDVLKARSAGGNPNELCFKSFFDATDFLDYIRRFPDKAHRVGDYDLGFADPPDNHLRPLEKEQVSVLYAQYGCM